MIKYRFLIGFVSGLIIGLIPPLVMMKMDSAKLNDLSEYIATQSDDLQPSRTPAPRSTPAPAVSTALELRVHDITDLQEAWKTIVPPASGKVVYCGPGKGVQVPGTTVGDDRVVVLFLGGAAEQQALALALIAASKPAAP